MNTLTSLTKCHLSPNLDVIIVFMNFAIFVFTLTLKLPVPLQLASFIPNLITATYYFKIYLCCWLAPLLCT